jgi:hypothetical protein
MTKLTARPPNGATGRGEFDTTTMQSVYAALLRVDLGRKLTNYPALAANNQFDPTNTTFQQAVLDRQKLAQDIFNVMCNADGTGNNTGIMGTVPLNQLGNGATQYNAATPEYMAVRWLAQLAVNIVDFIDSDDYITPFQWLPGNTTDGIVYGTEMPRVVINEYYAQWDNDQATLAGVNPNYTQPVGSNWRVNVWAELYAPFPQDANDPMNGTVLLQNGATNVYQLLICQGSVNTPPIGGMSIRDPSNTLGTPNPAQVVRTVNSWTAGITSIQPPPAAGVPYPAYSSISTPPNNNVAFYVVAPVTTAGNANNVYQAPLAGANPNLPFTYAPIPNALSPTNSMSYPLTVTGQALPNPITDPNYKPSLVLQRLLNPYLPANAPGAVYNPASPWGWNPYITVDYVDSAVANDGRIYDTVGNIALARGTPGYEATLLAYGRRQPYSAVANQWAPQAPNPPVVGQPQNTFFRQNGTTATPPIGADATLFYRYPQLPPAPPAVQVASTAFDVQYHPIAG